MHGKFHFLKLSLFLFMFSSMTAAAQEYIPLSVVYGSMLSGVFDTFLYPEFDFHIHPSVLGTAPAKFITFRGDLAFSSAQTTETRVDDALGVIGGTQTAYTKDFNGDFGLSWYHPQKNGTFGINAGWWFEDSGTKSESDRFDSPSEYKTEEMEVTPFSLSLSALKTLRSKFFTLNLDHGYTLGYNFAWNPAYFTWVNDDSQNPALSYIKPDETHDKDHQTHQADVRLDWGTDISILNLKFAAAYTFGYVNSDMHYIGIDTDGDTYLDKIVTYRDYVDLSAAQGGRPDDPVSGYPAEEVIGFEEQDRTFSHLVSLDLLGTIHLLPPVDLIVALGYTPLNVSIRDFWLRLPTASLPDESTNNETFSSDGGIFSVGLGGKFRDTKHGVNYSLFVGYKREGIKLSQDGLQPLGLYKYNSRNSGNYFEADLGLEPAVGDIVGSGALPSSSVVQDFNAAFGVEWYPRPTMILLFGLDLSSSWLNETYVVFNTATQTVWDESIQSNRVLWDLTPRIALTIPVGKTGALTSQISLLDIAGLVNGSSGDTPYNVNMGKSTTNGAYNTTDDKSVLFNIDLGLVFRF
jgi:hypothetical protein